MIIIPYGDRKGRRYQAHLVPSPILKWLAENAYNDRISTECDEEWQFRERYNQHKYDWED